MIKKLEGQEFGYLLVLRKHSVDKFRRTIWECKCRCGNIRLVATSLLTSDIITSCGCQDSRFGKIAHNFAGCKEISGAYWTSLKHGAKRRGLEFTITMEDAWQLFEQQQRCCALSGVLLTFARKYISDGAKEQTASLDRINGSQGYTIDNVRWVHKSINRMKMDIDDNEFLKFVKLIYENQLGELK